MLPVGGRGGDGKHVFFFCGLNYGQWIKRTRYMMMENDHGASDTLAEVQHY